MRHLTTISAYVLHYPRGHEPRPHEVDISIYEQNGRRYLHTPWAFLDFHGEPTEENIRTQLGSGYYESPAQVANYIKHVYPHWKEAAPIMSRLVDAIRWDGELVGVGSLADHLDLSREQLNDLARGKRKPTPEQLERAESYGGCVGRGC